VVLGRHRGPQRRAVTSRIPLLQVAPRVFARPGWLPNSNAPGRRGTDASGNRSPGRHAGYPAARPKDHSKWLPLSGGGFLRRCKRFKPSDGSESRLSTLVKPDLSNKTLTARNAHASNFSPSALVSLLHPCPTLPPALLTGLAELSFQMAFSGLARRPGLQRFAHPGLLLHGSGHGANGHTIGTPHLCVVTFLSSCPQAHCPTFTSLACPLMITSHPVLCPSHGSAVTSPLLAPGGHASSLRACIKSSSRPRSGSCANFLALLLEPAPELDPPRMPLIVEPAAASPARSPSPALVNTNACPTARLTSRLPPPQPESASLTRTRIRVSHSAVSHPLQLEVSPSPPDCNRGVGADSISNFKSRDLLIHTCSPGGSPSKSLPK
jgi:hypothetical protein